MTDRYTRVGGDSSAATSFVSGMAGAYATEDIAIAAPAAASDRFFYADDHAETVVLSGTKTITYPGAAGTPNAITCIDATSGADASGNAFGARAHITYDGDASVTINGHLLREGVDITLTGAVSARNIVIGNGSANVQRWCNTRVTTAAILNSRVSIGGVGTRTLLGPNFEVACMNGNGNVIMVGRIEWIDSTPFVGATIPTTLFYASNTTSSVTMRGCDLTAFGSKTLMPASTTAYHARLINCELPSTFTSAATQTIPGFLFEIENCSLPDGTLVNERHTDLGVVSMDGTVYRTGTAPITGSSYGVKMVSSSRANRYFPLASYDLWVKVKAADVGVAKTLTAFVANDGTTFAAGELWIEVDTLGDPDTLDTTPVSSGPANVSDSGTAPASDGVSSWTGVPGTPVKQTVETTYTAEREGLIRFRVMCGVPSETLWVDHQGELS